MSAGSGCGTVGREVASNTRDSRFKSNHQWIIISVNFIENEEISKEKEAASGPKKTFCATLPNLLKRTRFVSPKIKLKINCKLKIPIAWPLFKFENIHLSIYKKSQHRVR